MPNCGKSSDRMFLKNAWYVAAWSEEVVGELQQIKVLGEKICIYRNDKSEVIAMEDALSLIHI